MVQLPQTKFGGIEILNPTSTNYEEVGNVLLDILSQGKDIRTAEEAARYMKELEDDCVMTPLHKEGNPILIDSQYCALLWENQDEPGDTDYMAGLIFMLTEENGQNVFKRAGVIVGDEFEGVLQIRNGCCAGLTEEDKSSAYSMIIFIEQNGEIRHKTLDTPVTKQGCLKLLDNLPKGIQISSHQIAHMLSHHRHGPDHKCGHDHGNLPKLVKSS